MPGGLLNLVAYGNQNVILNGNPSKTFFKSTYSKYSNFGLQKFRIDYDGQRKLRLSEKSVFNFKVPRYADLLMDTYLTITLPNIWSPVVPPNGENNNEISPTATWQPYEFKWIENLGSQMIDTVKFMVGGQIIQEMSGQYLMNIVERDFSEGKKQLYYRMTGHVPELNDPANANGRVNVYPSCLCGSSSDSVYKKVGSEPSIYGRKLYIPLNIWFSLAAKMAFPLVSLQYSELSIEITIRPVHELFVVRYIGKSPANSDDNIEPFGYYHKCDLSDSTYAFHKFLHQPQDVGLTTYDMKRTDWNADIHLISTYCFLSDDEIRLFASQPQSYLIKQAVTTVHENVVGSKRVDIKSIGMITSWMWFLQRSDVNMRNEWSNYTNWPFNEIQPYNVIPPRGTNIKAAPFNYGGLNIYPDRDIFNRPTGIMFTGNYSEVNKKKIMNKWGLIVDGKYRENECDAGVLEYIEKYTRTKGNGKDGLYCYNFCLNSDPFDFQPSGAMNLSKFDSVEFEIETLLPSLDENAQVRTICDPETNEIIGIIKPAWGIYKYTYNLVVMEEKHNILNFSSGMAGLKFSR